MTNAVTNSSWPGWGKLGDSYQLGRKVLFHSPVTVLFHCGETNKTKLMRLCRPHKNT